MTLTVTIKREWFQMLLSGKKKEEYRDIKPYWTERLIDSKTKKPIPYTHIEFINGYAPHSPRAVFEFKGFHKGNSRPDWSGGTDYCYCIEVGNLISTKFC